MLDLLFFLLGIGVALCAMELTYWMFGRPDLKKQDKDGDA